MVLSNYYDINIAYHGAVRLFQKITIGWLCFVAFFEAIPTNLGLDLVDASNFVVPYLLLIAVEHFRY